MSSYAFLKNTVAAQPVHDRKLQLVDVLNNTDRAMAQLREVSDEGKLLTAIGDKLDLMHKFAKEKKLSAPVMLAIDPTGEIRQHLPAVAVENFSPRQFVIACEEIEAAKTGVWAKLVEWFKKLLESVKLLANKIIAFLGNTSAKLKVAAAKLQSAEIDEEKWKTVTVTAPKSEALEKYAESVQTTINAGPIAREFMALFIDNSVVQKVVEAGADEWVGGFLAGMFKALPSLEFNAETCTVARAKSVEATEGTLEAHGYTKESVMNICKDLSLQAADPFVALTGKLVNIGVSKAHQRQAKPEGDDAVQMSAYTKSVGLINDAMAKSTSISMALRREALAVAMAAMSCIKKPTKAAA